MRRSYDHPARRGTVPRVELRDVMRTTPATREFTDEPVPDEVVHDLLDVARFAPSGGNRQAWRVVVLRDPDLRRRIRDCRSIRFLTPRAIEMYIAEYGLYRE